MACCYAAYVVGLVQSRSVSRAGRSEEATGDDPGWRRGWLAEDWSKVRTGHYGG